MLYMKAEVEGSYELIVNKILRVPYFSRVKLYCGGTTGDLSWEYKNSLLGQYLKIVIKMLPHRIENNYTVFAIRNFNSENMGFYSCLRRDNIVVKETILITSCKL